MYSFLDIEFWVVLLLLIINKRILFNRFWDDRLFVVVLWVSKFIKLFVGGVDFCVLNRFENVVRYLFSLCIYCFLFLG